MVSETGPRVVRSNFCKGPNLSWKRAKKNQRAKRKFWGQQVLFGNQIYKIWPQKGQPGNPGLGLRLRFGVYGFTLPDKTICSSKFIVLVT